MSKRAAKRAGRGWKKLSETFDVLYYPARRREHHADAHAAFASVGIPKDVAALAIANAAVNDTDDCVLLGIDDERAVAIVKDEAGGVWLWQAMIGAADPDEAQAHAFADEVMKRLGDGCIMGVFSWRKPKSTAKH